MIMNRLRTGASHSALGRLVAFKFDPRRSGCVEGDARSTRAVSPRGEAVAVADVPPPFSVGATPISVKISNFARCGGDIIGRSSIIVRNIVSSIRCAAEEILSGTGPCPVEVEAK